jgi:ribonuclease HI
MTQIHKIYIASSCHFKTTIIEQQVGNGGYGVVIAHDQQKLKEFSGGYSQTTPARMDIMAIIQSLKLFEKPCNMIFYLGNQYVVDTLNKDWLTKWKKDNFKGKKHADLWMELDKLMQDQHHQLTFLHCQEVENTSNYERAKTMAQKISTKNTLPKDDYFSGSEAITQLTPSQIIRQTKEGTSKPDVKNSICVDASCLGNPGVMEYRGVLTSNSKEIFRRKYAQGTNNIGEFLAIVHALALYKNEQLALPIIYSDSQIAIGWVKKKICKTNLKPNPKNVELFEHIDRAVKWLNKNDYDTKILKWQTEDWGEIPADFGRK